jgi:hypothetical protein
MDDGRKEGGREGMRKRRRGQKHPIKRWKKGGRLDCKIELSIVPVKCTYCCRKEWQKLRILGIKK